MNVLITGSISYDEIMDFPGKFVDYFHPEKLHQLNISFAVNNLSKQLGGTGTNIAYNTQLILNFRFEIFNQFLISNNKFLNEKPKIKLLGAIGKDGKEFLKFFRKSNINTKGIVVDKKLYTATGKVITDVNDNQIWGFYYGASEKGQKISLEKYLGRDNFMIISANHPKAFLHFQEDAIRYKIPYIYDPGMSLTWIKDKDLKKGVMNCKYLIGNDYEIAMITKRLKITVKELINKEIKVITTLGEKGVRYEEVDKVSKVHKVYKVGAYKVKKVVDPTGAGDAWRGGFISGLAKGMKLRDCLRLGNVMASFAIEKYGTVNHKPTAKEIEKRLKSL